jgi:hypothetical protein
LDEADAERADALDEADADAERADALDVAGAERADALDVTGAERADAGPAGTGRVATATLRAGPTARGTTAGRRAEAEADTDGF